MRDTDTMNNRFSTMEFCPVLMFHFDALRSLLILSAPGTEP